MYINFILFKWSHLVPLFIRRDKRSVLILKLGELATIRTGLVLLRKKSSINDGIHYKSLNLRSICPESKIDLEELDDYYSSEELPYEYLTHKGDIVIRLTSPYTAILIDKHTENIVISSNFIVVRLETKKILPEYLTYLLNTDKIRSDIYKSSTSNMLSAVNSKFFVDLKLKDISIDNQIKISEIYRLYKREISLLKDLIEKKQIYYKNLLKNFQKEVEK